MIKKRQNKTGDIVSIPLAPTAWALIDDKRLHRQDELVFPRLTATKGVNPHQPLIAWRKRAGIEKSFGWHAGRHSFAMMTLEASGDIYAVSKLLGHSDIKITEVYLRMTDQRKKEIIASLPGIDTNEKREIVQIKTRKEEAV
jgi:integrase